MECPRCGEFILPGAEYCDYCPGQPRDTLEVPPTESGVDNRLQACSLKWAPLCPDFQLYVDVEIEVADGTKRVIKAGELLLAEDTTGHGHKTRTLDGAPRQADFIVLSS